MNNNYEEACSKVFVDQLNVEFFKDNTLKKYGNRFFVHLDELNDLYSHLQTSIIAMKIIDIFTHNVSIFIDVTSIKEEFTKNDFAFIKKWVEDNKLAFWKFFDVAETADENADETENESIDEDETNVAEVYIILVKTNYNPAREHKHKYKVLMSLFSDDDEEVPQKWNIHYEKDVF